MKMRELDMEEQLIRSKKHPEYIQALRDIETLRNIRQAEAVNRLGSAVKASEADFDAELKRVIDTFQATKRDRTWALICEFQETLLRTRVHPPAPKPDGNDKNNDRI